MSDERVQAVKLMIVEAAISANWPLVTMDNENVQKLFGEIPGFSQLRRTSMTELVDRYYDCAVELIRTSVTNEAESISFTTDSATTVAQDSVQALTAHWFDKDWNLRHCMLAVQDMEAEHSTGENLCDLLLSAFKKWNIQDKIFAGVTDNAANILKTMALLSSDDHIEESVRCCCHTLNLVVTNALRDNEITALLNKVKCLVTLFKKSPSMARVLESVQKERRAEAEALALQQENDEIDFEAEV